MGRIQLVHRPPNTGLHMLDDVIVQLLQVCQIKLLLVTNCSLFVRSLG